MGSMQAPPLWQMGLSRMEKEASGKLREDVHHIQGGTGADKHLKQQAIQPSGAR